MGNVKIIHQQAVLTAAQDQFEQILDRAESPFHVNHLIPPGELTSLSLAASEEISQLRRTLDSQVQTLADGREICLNDYCALQAIIVPLNFGLDEFLKKKLSGNIAIDGERRVTRLQVMISRNLDYSILQCLPNLKDLHVLNSSMEDLSPVSGLARLEKLDLGTCSPLRSLSGIEKLGALQTFGCRHALLEDLGKLTHLPLLKSLSIEEGCLVDIQPLASCRELRTLNLAGNRIDDCGPLQSLRKLNSLTLAANSISDFAALADLPELKTLHLAANPLADLTPLTRIPSLEKVYLSASTDLDFSPLLKVAGLKHVTLFRSDGNLTSLSKAVLRKLDREYGVIIEHREVEG